MLRTLGFVLAAKALIVGAVISINPLVGIRLWNWYLRRFAPESLDRPLDQESSRTAGVVRSVGLFSTLGALTALAMLALARSSRVS